jgi:hypothetical protein
VVVKVLVRQECGFAQIGMVRTVRRYSATSADLAEPGSAGCLRSFRFAASVAVEYGLLIGGVLDTREFE